jgi:large subunit ribosomal protein L20
MSRSPRSVPSHARRKKVFKQTKGMRGRRKNNITTANAAVDKSLQHNYIGRKEKKRNFRALWIQRINAAVRAAPAGPGPPTAPRRPRRRRRRGRRRGPDRLG